MDGENARKTKRNAKMRRKNDGENQTAKPRTVEKPLCSAQYEGIGWPGWGNSGLLTSYQSPIMSLMKNHATNAARADPARPSAANASEPKPRTMEDVKVWFIVSCFSPDSCKVAYLFLPRFYG